MIKQRTRVLSRALNQESLINNILTAVRGSLDYGSTLQTVVSELGRAFDTDFSVIYPVEALQGEDDGPSDWCTARMKKTNKICVLT